MNDSDSDNDKTNPTIKEHRMRLDRHLVGFNLKIHVYATPKDGDFAFCSIVRMLRSTFSSDDKEVWQHLKARGRH